MQALTLLLVFAATTLLVLGVYTLANHERIARAELTRERLREMRLGGSPASTQILRLAPLSSVPVLDMMLRGQPFAARLQRWLVHAGVRWSAGEFLLGSALTGVIGVIAAQTWGPIPALIGGALGLALPAVYVARRAATRARLMETQLPDAVDMIVNAMRAGFSFPAAMKFVGEELPAPLGLEFARYTEEQRLGADARAALLDLEERIGSLDAKMLVTALLVQRETGGNLGEILTNLANLIRDRGALREHITTLTAEPRASARILGILPVITFGTLYALNPEFMRPLISTQPGIMILVYAATSAIVGYLILKRIATIDV